MTKATELADALAAVERWRRLASEWRTQAHKLEDELVNVRSRVQTVPPEEPSE